MQIPSTDYKHYEQFYKDLHANPELSTLETETANKIQKELERISGDFEIKKDIGDYSKQPHAWPSSDPDHPKPIGTGTVAILRNGDGPTVLLRADIDALPVEEQTGLEYASTKTMTDTAGQVQPVMHACGHDMHTTSLLVAADLLTNHLRDQWSGTCIFCFQPAEEKGVGAQAMVDGGLYDPDRHNVPKPDVVLGGHVLPVKAGVIGVKQGAAFSSGDSTKVTIHGIGTHGSMPHTGIDPVVIASYAVTRLQTLVSREIDPGHTACCTVGAIQAGEVENVVANKAVLRINTRAFTNEDRQTLKDGVKRIIDAECTAGRTPKDAEYETISALPLTWNDEEAAAKLQKTFANHFQSSFDDGVEAQYASEDFSNLATAIDKPYVFWFYGGSDTKNWEEGERGFSFKKGVPINHSGYYAPVIQPTMQTAAEAFIIGAFTYLGKDNI